MTERTDTPPLLTALELDRLRARLEAQDARIEELQGLLRIAPGMSRLGAVIITAPAVAVTALAVIVGILSWQQAEHMGPAPVAVEAPAIPAPTAQSQPSRFMLPPLRPPNSRG